MTGPRSRDDALVRIRRQGRYSPNSEEWLSSGDRRSGRMAIARRTPGSAADRPPADRGAAPLQDGGPPMKEETSRQELLSRIIDGQGRLLWKALHPGTSDPGIPGARSPGQRVDGPRAPRTVPRYRRSGRSRLHRLRSGNVPRTLRRRTPRGIGLRIELDENPGLAGSAIEGKSWIEQRGRIREYHRE